MKKIKKLTESDLNKLVKKILSEDDIPINIRRRINKNELSDLIKNAKDEVDEDDYDDYFDYLDNVIYFVVQELQGLYGDKDDFWYDNEDDIIDFIKDNFDDELF